MKNSVVIVPEEVVRKIKSGHLREERMEQGFCDGRFRPRVVIDKKKESSKRSCRRSNWE